MARPQIAQEVWDAVNDMSGRVIHVAGADAKGLYAQRLQVGVDAFRASVKQLFLGG